MASEQSDDPDACIAAVKELAEVAQASTPLSPFAFRALEVLAKFLSIERIPEKASSGDNYERVVFSAASALWSYSLANKMNPEVSVRTVSIMRLRLTIYISRTHDSTTRVLAFFQRLSSGSTSSTPTSLVT
jgi:hypothetical protein